MIERDRIPPPWLWPNILSLDAPIVALVWQDFISRCYPSPLRMPGRLVLGLTVWAIYIADRLLDARQPPGWNESSRHRFYRKYRVLSTVFLGLVVSLDAWLAVTELRPAVFRNGLLIAGAVSVYLWLFSFARQNGRYGKQVAGSLVFASGVFLVAWTGTGVSLGASAAFFALCLGNMALVESWERNERLDSAWLWLLALSTICWLAGNTPYFHAISASAAALGILGIWGTRTTAGELRGVLADVALLSPLLFR